MATVDVLFRAATGFHRQIFEVSGGRLLRKVAGYQQRTDREIPVVILEPR